MNSYLAVGIGGAAGSVLRFWLSTVAARAMGDGFPWGTILVNVTGSFVIGVVAAAGTPPNQSATIAPALRQFLMIGICGGYTTFSSFSLQTLELANQGAWIKAGGNVIGSVVLCLVAVWLGSLLGASITRSS